MLGDDQGAAQRDHHEDAEQTAQHRDEHDARDLEVEPENHDRRHRHADPEGDGFPCASRRLNDVVLEDRRVLHPQLRGEPEERDRDDGDRNRGADRESHLEDEVQGRRTEDDPEDRPEDDSTGCELSKPRLGRDVGMESGGPRVVNRLESRPAHGRVIYPCPCGKSKRAPRRSRPDKRSIATPGKRSVSTRVSGRGAGGRVGSPGRPSRQGEKALGQGARSFDPGPIAKAASHRQRRPGPPAIDDRLQGSPVEARAEASEQVARTGPLRVLSPLRRRQLIVRSQRRPINLLEPETGRKGQENLDAILRYPGHVHAHHQHLPSIPDRYTLPRATG